MACYVVTPIDEAIATKVEGWSGRDVARLRGMYEEKYTKPEQQLDVSNPDNYSLVAKKLSDLRKSLLSNHLSKSTTNVVDSFIELQETYSAETRYNRIRFIAQLFSDYIDLAQKNGEPYTRQQIANGIDGKHGQFAIFDQIYNDLRARYQILNGAGNTMKADKIGEMLDNFGALCTYARIVLRDLEGLKLGSSVEYADDTTPSDFSINDLTELYNAEESTKEKWQECNDFISAYGTVTASVRRVLSTIKQVDENGNLIKDDLDIPMYINPITAHQTLIEELINMRSEEHMLELISKSHLLYRNQLLKKLNPPAKASTSEQASEQKTPNYSNQIRTQFFTDLYKNFQLYKEVSFERQPSGVFKVRTYIKNKLKNMLTGTYATRIKMGQTLSKDGSVYNSDGSINWKNIQKVRATINDYLTPSFVGTEGSTKYYTASQEDKVDFLLEVSSALGIDLDRVTAQRISKDRQSSRLYTNNLHELVTYGIDALLNDEDKKKLNDSTEADLKISRKEATFRELYKAKTSTQKQSNPKKGNIEEKIEKMLDVVAKNREAFRVESRVTHKGKNGKTNVLYSHVNPSYLGDFLKDINGYAKEQNVKGLQNLLQKKFLDSSEFMLNGKILNRWIEDLYNDPLNGKGGFAEMISYSRFLGSVDEDFENFTSKQHVIEMMNEYFFAENDMDKTVSGKENWKKYAHYPVFILGDSGVCKYIKAKRYSAQEILDGMYNIYLSECQRNLLAKATHAELKNGGYGKIDNLSESGFKMLPFLQDEKYRPKRPNMSSKEAEQMEDATNWTEKEVKDAIVAYMKDAVEEFTNKITDLGVLETGKDGKTSLYFDSILKGSENFKNAGDNAQSKMIADFYWNTKFATLQQFQMMTIDVAYYKNTKDLQKRYKEIHAPGSKISVQAKDFHNNYYCGVDSKGNINTAETVVYFDDPQINAEVTNPEFMDAIAFQYGKGDIEAGRKTKVYQDYKKNALADGQGYRTLPSYRKVMGMAGKWTYEMEQAYERIQALRVQYGEDADIPVEVLDEIAQLAITFQPIKPFLFTIENYAMNNNGGVLKIPVQHKYAEVLLIPELLPANSKLRHMALWMENHKDAEGKAQPIDMLGAWSTGGDKIVKVGGFGSTDITELDRFDNLKNDDGTPYSIRQKLEMALNEGYVHKLNYGDYRIQTNVPEHVNSSQLFGTQLRKLIMAGIDFSKNYAKYVGNQKVNIDGQEVELNGRNLVNFYNSLIVANILDSWDSFKNDVGNIESLSKILQQGVVNNSRESLENLLAYAIDKGDFHMPLFEGGLEHDSASLLLSLFKKAVNKQIIKGGSAVQASAMGISGYATDGDLKYVVDDDKNILYAEIEMPWDITVNIYNKETGKYDAKELQFSDYCDSKGNLLMSADGKTSKLEMQFPGALDRVCYRIPTERDYSMINAKVKRFSQKTSGAVIKVPPQGTTIAGFDFDIDKLYFMQKEFFTKDNTAMNKLFAQFKANTFTKGIVDLLELEEYDYTKDALHQHSNPKVARALRNNMLISLIQQRLSDPETFEQRTTPGGFSTQSIAAREIRELQFAPKEEITTDGKLDWNKIKARAADKSIADPEPNYDPSDPMTIIIYNQANQVAGKLIGVFANQNTNHAFASLMSVLRLKASAIKDISFCDHNYYDLLNAAEGTNPAQTIAEFLSASVDAVKDPVLNYLYFNTITADAAGFLARLGYTGQEIGILFNQPVIKEVCELSFNSGISIEKAIEKVKENFIVTLTANNESLPNTTPNLSTQNLGQAILDYRDLKTEPNRQLLVFQFGVLKQFSNILGTAKEVSDFIASTKFTASNAVGSTFGSMYAQQMKVKNYIKNLNDNNRRIEMLISESPSGSTVKSNEPPINPYTDLQQNNERYLMEVLGNGIVNPFAYEQAMYDMNVRAIKLLCKYYPYETTLYKGIRELAANLTRGQILDADTVDSIHQDVLRYALAQQEGAFDGSGMKQYRDDKGNVQNIEIKDYYLKIFPAKLYRLLQNNPSLGELAIFKYMFFDENGDFLEPKIQDVGGLTTSQKDEIRDSWSDLATEYVDESNPSSINSIAMDLFMYCYHKSGFVFGSKSFMHLAPVVVKDAVAVNFDTEKPISYTDFLRTMQKGNVSFDQQDFMRHYILNHTDNYRFNYRVASKNGTNADKEVRKLVLQNGKYVNSFELTQKHVKDSHQFNINGDFKKSSKGNSEWIPCIIVDGQVYITRSSNKSTNGRMIYDYAGQENEQHETVYLKVQQTLEETTLGIEAPTEVNTQGIEGSTDQKSDIPDAAPKATLKERTDEIVESAAKSALESGYLMPEQIKEYKLSLKEALKGSTEDEIREFLEEVAKEYGPLVDKENNIIC